MQSFNTLDDMGNMEQIEAIHVWLTDDDSDSARYEITPDGKVYDIEACEYLTPHNEDYEMLRRENKAFAVFLRYEGYTESKISDIANGSFTL